ncbi:alpha/beta fold hydrolase [Flavobacterium sp. 3HN19-14]|uniref:alpha/beta fold hydrolase n=1 Tax=Flavobacterium sp. 3HN19-14 TaxID=3448133 RepID=UPI003EE32FF6
MGNIAEIYTSLGYDCFIPDYRGYGKSGGEIESESQFLSDVDLLYKDMLKRYAEDKIVIIGYSIGT